jgi:predicted MPP superfamily phosphohydrolase
MSEIILLHLTDFHIHDPNGTNENLREAFYDTFFSDLVEMINEYLKDKKIDYLILTGDFINCGNTTEVKIEKKYFHVKKVIEYLRQKLNIHLSDTITCIGNHDIILDGAKSDQGKKSRKHYYKFSENYKFKKLISSSEICEIYFDEEREIYFSKFDSTFKTKKNQPGVLTNTEIDEIRKALRIIPSDKPLIVISHYPMIVFPRSNLYIEETNWIENHLWTSGNKLVESVYKLRKKSLTVWLFGDSHVPDFWSYNEYHHFFMTGMIGGNYVNPSFKDKEGNSIPFEKSNELKLIKMDLNSNVLDINTFSYKPVGALFSQHNGKWNHFTSKIRLVDNPFNKGTIKVSEENEDNLLKRNIDTGTALISSDVQNEILDEIRIKELYRFNRFVTSKEHSSLGWISIFNLFEKKSLFIRCIEKSIDWIRKNIVFDDSKKSIFIGVNYWGTTFASYASVRTNVNNLCVATRSDGKYQTNHESIEYLCEKIKTFKELENIIIFTDVISTGETVINLKNKIQFSLKDIKFKWILISIISDKSQSRYPEINEFHYKGSLCTDLKIPIIRNDDLPSNDYLPPFYDLR